MVEMVGATGIEPIAGSGLTGGFHSFWCDDEPSFTLRFYRMRVLQAQDSSSVRACRRRRAASSASFRFET